MCGIAAVLVGSGSPALPDWPFHGLTTASFGRSSTLPDAETLLATLERRGPDSSGRADPALPAQHCEHASLTLLAATLSLRHKRAPPHPYSRKGEFSATDRKAEEPQPPLLLFNGELYDVPAADDGSGEHSDTQLLYNTLEHALRNGNPDDELAVLTAIDALAGPFTFILWSPASKRLYFARDFIGRRSLLLASIEGVGTVLTSAAPRGYQQPFLEVPPIGLCYIDFRATKLSFGFIARQSHVFQNRLLPADTSSPKRAPRILSTDYTRPREVTSYLPLDMLRTAEPQLTDQDSPFLHSAPTMASPVNGALHINPSDAVTKFLAAFELSVRRRLAFVPCYSDLNTSFPVSSSAIPSAEANPHPYAVLFSGGLDSLFLAAILDRVMPKGQRLDLVNIAFGHDAASLNACPDRITAISGYHELTTLSAGRREFRLICANCLPNDADEALESHVRHLVHPGSQPMDASVGTALWLAARGQGVVYESGSARIAGGEEEDITNEFYVSPRAMTPAKIMFSGLGADELMGGYKGRHRTSFALGGVQAIERELDSDLSRLWYRNLGRDDRLVSDHGRELRHPFLDEDLIRLVAGLPLVECVCDLSLPDGVGDKFLLRKAADLIGLPPAAVQREKRAMQFGSRSKQVLERKQAA
jgi:asparagine synthetase B (glutamine-hydrolysing)